ncbi:MAG: DinB family protein [Jatrophihabitans sp.]
MTTPDDGADRTEPPHSGDERAILNGFLDFHRETLQWKCTGLSPSQLATAASPPSPLTLLGMVRHITENERWWFQGFVDESIRSLYCTDDRDGDWHVPGSDEVGQALVDQAWADWTEAVAESRRVVAATDLDAIGFTDKPERSFSMRWVLTHMIEEYCRHNGHADLLREALDGSTGE